MSAAALASNSTCYDHCIPDGAKLGALIYIAMQNAGLSMTPQELAEASACYANCIPMGAQIGALLYLYDNGGSVGSTNYNLSGAADPVTDPADTAENWFYRNTNTNTLWWWEGGGASWTQIV